MDRLGDGLHRLGRLLLQPLELQLLGDAVELHEGGVRADRAEALQAEDGALVLALARPVADEGRELEGRAVAAQEADRPELLRSPFGELEITSAHGVARPVP
jgi:hypothetical protein